MKKRERERGERGERESYKEKFKRERKRERGDKYHRDKQACDLCARQKPFQK